jgi:hypothetical protein
MKIALINAGKWELAIKGRSMSKAHEATLTLGSLRQRTRATGRTLCACPDMKEICRKELI